MNTFHQNIVSIISELNFLKRVSKHEGKSRLLVLLHLFYSCTLGVDDGRTCLHPNVCDIRSVSAGTAGTHPALLMFGLLGLQLK